ncbi:MAG: transglutaminaseTgpA domain-containing protein [Rudaea sp.]
MTTPKTALTPLQFGLTAAAVLVAVLPHLTRLPWWIGAPILAVFALRWLQRRRDGSRIPAWIKLPLVLLFPVLIVFHYGNLFGREPGSALACAMLALKLMETETRRDARAAICFAAFVLMSALFFEHSLAFTAVLSAALIVLLAALRALESPRTRLVADLRGGSVTLAAALPLAVCVFVFFPRLSSPLWGAPNDTTARTGLGDRMAPGTMQELLIDDSPAFRVRFDGAPPPRNELYWRGPVLWQFDGNAWTRPEFFAAPRNAGVVRASSTRVGYEVTLEPSARHWLLALDVPLAAPAGAVRGADMSLVSRERVDNLLRYRMVSAPHYVLDPKLSASDRRMALQLPAGFDPGARELAQRWRSEFRSDEGIIRVALELFHREFSYTLNAPLLSRDSIDDFLFNTKRGFCEHFASAFTFLMRAAGIPARVVTGYQGGYFNRLGDYWVVRQSDAHAWSEVWLSGRGWVRVDPTAAVSPQRVELGAAAAAGASAPWYQADWLLALRNRFDLVNRFWNDAIVRFDALRQSHLLTPFGVDRADYPQLMTALLMASTLLLGLVAWWVLRTPRSESDPLDAAYARLCRKLARAGAARGPAEGPLTFAARVAAQLPEQFEVAELLSAYVGLRYACALPSPERIRFFTRSVASLRLPLATQMASQSS